MRIHGRSDTINIIADAGLLHEYLSAYSLDFNPIEYTWAQAKAHRRKTGENEEQTLKLNEKNGDWTLANLLLKVMCHP